MTFYALHEGYYEGVQLRLDQLRTACDNLGVNFVSIDSLSIDYSDLPQLGKSDILYNTARGSQILESLLLNEFITTFYIKLPSLIQTYSTTDWSIIHSKEGIISPKTVFSLTNDRILLSKYVAFVGGFPLVLKVVGGTRGIGVIKIDSWQNLISVADYLVTTGDKFIIRQYIKAKSGCRIIVLGDQVIAGADFEMNEGDFRNAVVLSQVKYYKREYPEIINETAIRATHLANVEFSGVDLLEDEFGNYYVLEINFPTGFSGLIDICDVDIPGKIVEYLAQKSSKKNQK